MRVYNPYEQDFWENDLGIKKTSNAIFLSMLFWITHYIRMKHLHLCFDVLTEYLTTKKWHLLIDEQKRQTTNKSQADNDALLTFWQESFQVQEYGFGVGR